MGEYVIGQNVLQSSFQTGSSSSHSYVHIFFLIAFIEEDFIKHIIILCINYTWGVQVLRSPKEAFAAAMQSWREHCEKCVCLQGDYVEK